MLLRTLFSLAIGLATIGVLRAEDPKTDPKEPAKPASPAEPAKDPAKPAPVTAAPAATTPPTAAETEFNKLFAKWKVLLGQLRDLHIKYEVTKPDSREPLKEEFNKLIAQGQAMEPDLRKAAVVVFSESPEKNKEARELLLAMLNRDVRLGHDAAALPLAKLLADQKVGNARTYDLAGRIAFYANDFDAAEKYFKQAAEGSALSPEGTKMQKEAAIRKAEAKDNLPRVKIKTAQGDIVVELFENEAPIAVANFISLVEKKYYDGLTFHRVLDNFMAQGGDPKGDGTGGPGYRIPCECQLPNHRLHFRGSLSMAHAGQDTGGSQFFLTFTETANLDGKHTVFGRVIEGMDVLNKITRRDPTKPSQPEPDKILEMTVVRKKDHPYEPKKLPDLKP